MKNIKASTGPRKLVKSPNVSLSIYDGGFNMSGLESIVSDLDDLIQNVDEGLILGLDEAAMIPLRESRPLVPVDTGALLASGKMERDGDFTRIVSYHAESVEGYDYAVVQHEVNFNHEAGKQMKYLQQPFNENLERMVKVVGEHVGRSIK